MEDARRFCITVDEVFKLGSYPVPQNGRTVHMMDKITTQELKGAIFEDSWDDLTHPSILGYLLDTILSGFSTPIPSVESLMAPREIISKHSPAIAAAYPNHTQIPLYNSSERRWNWPLPTPGNSSLETEMRASSGGKLEAGWQENHIASFFNTIAAALAPAILPAIGEESHHNEKAKPKYRHWLAHSNRRLPGTANGAGAYDRHPDLILLESADHATEAISWLTPTVLGEYTSEAWKPSMRLSKTLHTKAYLVFLDQPWRRFVLCLSMCRHEMRIHYYDRSGVRISPPFDIHESPDKFLKILAAIMFGPRVCIGFDPTVTVISTRPLRTTRKKLIQPPSGVPTTIHEDGDGQGDSAESGRIRVNDNWYRISDTLFSSPGFLGRGTIVYLATRNGKSYVIKDHWVVDPANEVTMMKRVQGIPGVPEIVEHWRVQVINGIVDRTYRYRSELQRNRMRVDRTHMRLVISPCGRPLTQFRTKRELIQCVRDVLQVLSSTVQRGVLHRDVSPFNVLIQDLPDGFRGILIDWEFAAEITQSGIYGVGGTGTIPFLSRSLLCQISDGLRHQRAQLAGHSASNSTRITSMSVASMEGDFTLVHRPEDDIESLFYVLFWIMVLYNGPRGQEREDFDFELSILSQWTESSISNLDAAKNSKSSLLSDRRQKAKLAEHVSPYFRDLVPLLEDWRSVFRDAEYHGKCAEVDDCLHVLDSHLTNIPPEDGPTTGQFVREEKTKTLKESVPRDPLPQETHGIKKRERGTRETCSDSALPLKRFKARGS